MDMLNQLLASQVDHSLVRKLKTYADPTLLVVDELGYLSLDQHNSNSIRSSARGIRSADPP